MTLTVDVCSIITLDSLHNSEVDQFQSTSHKQEIGCFQVAMNDALLVYTVDCAHHLLPCQSDEVHVQ
jgi:hypothetical protein